MTDEKRKLLEKIVSRFRNVRWAVAYGSGVFEQDGYDPNAVSWILVHNRDISVLMNLFYSPSQ